MIDKKPLNVEIGKRIRLAREQSGLTREKLAERIDVTPRFVADFERGSVGISVPNLKKICEVLHVSSDFILWGKLNDKLISIDERLNLFDDDYKSIIERVVQCQIDLINLAEHRKSTGSD